MSTSSQEVFHDIDWMHEDPLFDYVDPLLQHPQIHCVLRNDVEDLKKLLESGRSVNISDNNGNTPLHHAVLHEKDKVFNFLLTIEDLQINARNHQGQTALLISMDCENKMYAQKLLELGADPNIGSDDNITPLHEVLSVEIAKMLIEKGAQLNAQTIINGETPLFTACIHGRDDILHLLLYYGANPTIPSNNGISCLNLAMWGYRIELQHILLPYFIDMDADGKVAICLHDFYVAMKYSSDIFPQLLEACTNIFYNDGNLETLAENLLDLDVDYFHQFIAKFRPVLVDMFEDQRHRYSSSQKYEISSDTELGTCITNLNTLNENNLLTDTVNVLLRYCDYFLNFHFITDDTIGYEEQMQLALNLIGHGLPLKFKSLCKVHQTFGYCDLFSSLLQYDRCDNYIPRQKHGSLSMVALIAEVPLTIEQCLKTPEKYIFESSVLDLLEQFALWELQQFCISQFESNEAIKAKLKALPTVPKLLELSRNAARRHFVNKFDMTSSKHLYTYINSLKISQVYKDILSFKQKLYL